MIDPCTEYGLALAIEDFVPVLLAGAGLVALSRSVSRPAPAMIGGALVFVGGLGKATWKLLVAMEPCRQYDILEQLLFPCLAVGFGVVLWAVTGRIAVLALPMGGVAGAVALQSTGPLVAVAAVAAIALGVTLGEQARRRGDWRTATLFLIYVIGTLILPPLAAQPEQPEWLQWIEQLTNTVVQGCFLLGALRLARDAETRPTPSPVTTGATS
jgi:hypothetical protein